MNLNVFRRYAPYVILFFFACLFVRPFDANPDFFHHIASGKFIVMTHAFPFTDTLTHTAYGKPWIAYAWGSGIILYLLYTTLGPVAISLFFGLIAYFTLLLLWKLLETYKLADRVKILAIGMVVPLLLVRFPHRPEVLTYPFLVSLLYIGRCTRKHPIYLWMIPFILLLWSNMYGSSTIIGLILSIILLVRYAVSQKKIFSALSVILLSILASLLNPNGIKSLLYILYIPKVATYEGEWAGIIDMIRLMPQSYLIGAQYSMMVYAIVLLILVILFTFVRKQLIRFPFELLCSLSLLIPIFAFRQIALAGILITPLFAIALSSVPTQNILPYICTVIIGSLCSLMLYTTPMGVVANTVQIDRLLAFAKDSGIHGNVLNQVQLGSIIGYYLSPSLRPFVDTRDDLFLESRSQKDLYEAVLEGKDIHSMLSDYAIDVIVADLITDTLSYQPIFYSPDWSVVYLQDRYMIAVRKHQADELKLQTYSFADPFSPTGAKRGFEDKAAQYYQSQLEISPESYFSHTTYGTILLASGHPTEALRVFESTPIQKGPYKKIFDNEITTSEVIALSKIGACDQARMKLDTISGTRSFGLVGFIHPISTKKQKSLAWYYLLCERNRKKSAESLQQYLTDSMIPPSEKNATQLLYTAEFSH